MSAGIEKKPIPVVTSILEYDSKILILKRSPFSKSMKNKWGGISGYLESNEDLLSRALTEIREETGISYEQVLLRKILDPITVIVETNRVLTIHPFHFISMENEVKLDWEHTEYQWINVTDLRIYDLVPKLEELIKHCFEQKQ